MGRLERQIASTVCREATHLWGAVNSASGPVMHNARQVGTCNYVGGMINNLITCTYLRRSVCKLCALLMVFRDGCRVFPFVDVVRD